jgi:hypothetical protein
LVGFKNQRQTLGWWSSATVTRALAIYSLLLALHFAAHGSAVLF